MAKSKTYELAIKIAGKVDSSLKKSCLDASRDLDTLGASAKKAGKLAATAMTAAGTAVAAVAATSLSTYADFEQAMANTAAIAGANTEQYEALEAAAREMGAKTTKTATEAAEALGYMALAGWDTQQSIAGLEPVLRLSEATQMDLARCSDLVTDSMSALGLGVEDMQGYLDLAVQTNNKANTTAESLMEAFIGCGGAAKTTGVDLTELSTALGILANNGTKGAEAGTAMNAMLVRMTSKDTAIKSMKKLGVSAFDAQGNFRGLETVFGDLSNAMANLSTEERASYMSQIAGTNYYTEMSYLLDAVTQGADGAASAWTNLEGQLQGKDGALMNMAGQITNTLKSSKEIFMSAVEEAQLTIGEQLAPYAQEAFAYLANEVLPEVTTQLGIIIPQLIEGAKWAWQNRETILKVAGAVSAAVVTFKALKTAGTAVSAFKNLKTIFAAATKNGGAMGTVLKLLGGKFTIIIAIIAAVAAAFVILWNRSETFRTSVTNLWGKIQPFFQALGSFAQMVWNNIAPSLEFLATVLINGLGNAFEVIAPIVGNIIGVFTGLINFITGVFSGNWEQAWQGICDIVSNLLNGLVNIAKIPINAIIGAINAVIGAINSCGITIPDWVPVLGGKKFSISLPEIPMLAAGGIATAPTLAQIGEGGEPEAVLPLSKLVALLDEWTRKPRPGGGGAPRGGAGDGLTFSPVFNFYGPTTKEEAQEAGRVSFAEFKRLYERMKAEERRKQFSPA